MDRRGGSGYGACVSSPASPSAVSEIDHRDGPRAGAVRPEVEQGEVGKGAREARGGRQIVVGQQRRTTGQAGERDVRAEQRTGLVVAVVFDVLACLGGRLADSVGEDNPDPNQFPGRIVRIGPHRGEILDPTPPGRAGV